MNWSPGEIRMLRKELGDSVEAFARRLSVSGRAVTYWEDGERRPGGTARVLFNILQEQLNGRT